MPLQKKSVPQEARKLCRSVMDALNDVILIFDPRSFRILDANKRAVQVYGYSRREIMRKEMRDFTHEVPNYSDLLRGDKSVERTDFTKTGEKITFLVSLSVIDYWGRKAVLSINRIANNQLHDPDIAAVIFTARDLRFRRETEATIHEANVDFDKRVEERALELAKANAALRLENQQRRHTETQLKHSLSLLNSTLESTADGILVISREGLITSCNQKFLEMWRIPLMAVLGLRDEVLLSMATPQVQDTRGFQQGIRFLHGKPDAVRFDTIRLKDGRVFQRYTQPQRVGDETVGRIWSFRDITQPYRLEEELRHAQKMEAIVRLAGGVAHDFNNLLMLISGYANQILEDLELPAEHKESVEQLLAASDRAASLTRQLLSFSRKQPVALQRVDLNTLASGMPKMLSRLLSERVEFVLDLQPGSLPIYADPSQIELMIMNLVLNARDAMPEGGRLTITTRAGSLPGGAERYEESLPFDFACLEVADTGHGMAPEIKEHIFEPFFTTKEVGKGTGLGLSTAYGIVEQAGGHISVDSVPKRGTTFRVFLPMAGERPQDLGKKKPSRAGAVIVSSTEIPVPAHHETILLVEDEAGIRAMTRTYLEREGYLVLGAADGDEAIRIARQYPGRIDLIVTDVIMPGTRGNDLVRAIRETRPSVIAIYITGYAEAALDVDANIVEKPFTFPDLEKCIREVLDEARKKEPFAKKSA